MSHPSERQLLSDLDILLHIVSQQRQYCVNLSYFALHEEDEQQSTTRVGVRIVRSGVGRPRLDISEELLEALYVTAGFRWAAIGRYLHVSERTLRRRRHELGFANATPSFTDLDNGSLDEFVRDILQVKKCLRACTTAALVEEILKLLVGLEGISLFDVS